MKTRFIEARTAGMQIGNHGKFLVGRFDTLDYRYVSKMEEFGRLLGGVGVGARSVLVVDLATGEGAFFPMGGSASNDLRKHRVWVCVLFEGFLEWLYTQNLDDFDKWPAMVEVEAEFAFSGYRREGPAACGVCGADPSHWRALS